MKPTRPDYIGRLRTALGAALMVIASCLVLAAFLSGLGGSLASGA